MEEKGRLKEYKNVGKDPEVILNLRSIIEQGFG
jgi:hypothetical protein